MILNYNTLRSFSKSTQRRLSQYEKKKEAKEKYKTKIKHLGLGAGVGLGTALALKPIQAKGAKILESGMSRTPLDPNTLHDLVSNHTSQTGNSITIVHDPTKHTTFRRSAGKDLIIVGKSKIGASTPQKVAHELGHAKGGVLQTLGNNKVTASKLAITGLSGVRGGYKTEMSKLKGRKPSISSRVGGLVGPTIHALTSIPAEIQASRRGYVDLKQVGVDPRVLKNAKNDYKLSLGLKALDAGSYIATGLAARQVGKKLAKKEFIKDLKKKHPDWTSDQLDDAYNTIRQLHANSAKKRKKN